MSDVSDKVDFRLSFIGTLTNDDGVQCKHGQTECLGNILMLCAAAEYPDPKLYLGFSNCLINDYQEIPNKSLIEDCALEHGLDFDTLNQCMSKDTGAYGMGLLRDSVQHSMERLRQWLKARGPCARYKAIIRRSARLDVLDGTKVAFFLGEGEGRRLGIDPCA
jgi:hypothetical protein